MNTVFVYRDRAKNNVSFPMVVWALAMTVILFMAIVTPSATVTITGFAPHGAAGCRLGLATSLWSGHCRAVRQLVLRLVPDGDRFDDSLWNIEGISPRACHHHRGVDRDWIHRVRLVGDGGSTCSLSPWCS
jgi:hypothetical protein